MPDAEFLFGPVPHQEAVDFIKSKPVVSRQVFDGLLPELKGRAFTVTGLEGQANIAQAIRDRIAELPAGHDWNAVKKDVANDISPFMVDPHASAEEQAGQLAAADARAELLLRTHGFQAYQAAQYQVMDRHRDVMPYWQYQTMEDERVRPEHAALDQVVLPADSPFWNSHFPPWDWGCRCQVIPLSQLDYQDVVDKDKDRPSDNKLVLQGPVAKHLEDGTLVRAGRTYDVRPPTDKEGGSGFTWDPSSLRLSVDQLKERYKDQPQTWAEFEAFAKQTKLGPGQPTVWEWLGGKPTTPTPISTGHSPTPAPAPRPTLDDFVAQHTAQPGQMTQVEAEKFVTALKQPHGIKTADKVTSISIARSLPSNAKAFVAATVQEFIDVVPKHILDALPPIKISVIPRMSALGEYDRATHKLRLNRGIMASNAEARRVLYHELAHWLHLHGPAEYSAVIEEHFNGRTIGEVKAQLPYYARGAIGKKDKFWDSYMGRVYAGIPDGCEIPTKVFELLSDPSKLSMLWNIPIHRETIKVALAILFA